MAARLTPTDALLALAAAQSPAEVNAARLALIETGSAMLRPLDRRGVLVGDGTAGHLLLGGAAHRAPDNLWSVARRAGMITIRENPQDVPVVYVQGAQRTGADVSFALVDEPDLQYAGGAR